VGYCLDKGAGRRDRKRKILGEGAACILKVWGINHDDDYGKSGSWEDVSEGRGVFKGGDEGERITD